MLSALDKKVSNSTDGRLDKRGSPESRQEIFHNPNQHRLSKGLPIGRPFLMQQSSKQRGNIMIRRCIRDAVEILSISMFMTTFCFIIYLIR